jgi:hypothetical protein
MTFTALCIPILFHGTLKIFHNKLNHKFFFNFFFQLSMDQMITFNISLDSEKKPYQTEPKKTTCAHLKKKVDYR